MKRLLPVLLLAPALLAQGQSGELHLKVVDPSGLPVKGLVEIVCESNHFREKFPTDDGGRIVARKLSLGLYTIHIQQQGFAPYTGSMEVRSAIPTDFVAHLSVNPVNTSVAVKDSDTLVNPRSTGSVEHIGQQSLDSAGNMAAACLLNSMAPSSRLSPSTASRS